MQEFSFPPQVYLEISKKKVSSCVHVFVFWFTKLMVQISALPWTSYGQVTCYLSVAALQIILKLGGLKQQTSLYYFSWFLWVGSFGRAWLVQYLSCG